MKAIKIIKIWNLLIVLITFLFILPFPGLLIGGGIPSIEDVIAGKVSLPTIEDLTGGKVKIEDLIDKNNVDLVKEYLSPGNYVSVKKGMILKMGTQLPPDQLYPKTFREATEKNRGKAVMDKNGVVYYEKMGNLWPGGLPFPRATSGLEAKANHTYGRVWDEFRTHPINMWYINSKGRVYKTVGQDHRYIKCATRTTVPPYGAIPGYENIMFKRISVATHPLEIKGLGQFTVRYYDDTNHYDTGFAYLPAFKRTIRVSATTWQDNIAGSDMTYGDGEGLQEPCSDWNFKLIGKKFILATEPKSSFPILDKKGKVDKRLQFDVGKKFPRLGWTIWPVYVVECMPAIKHVYGKKIIYIPIWPYWTSSFQILMTDIYDRQMKQWKVYNHIYGYYYYVNGEPYAVTAGCTMYDFQVDHMTIMWMNNRVNQLNYNADKDINLGTLLKIGR